jgi:carboxymethylenebutenolidase
MAFVIAHEEPLPFTLENPKGENISFPVKGEDAGKAYYIKGKKSSKKWIFVFQEWWGLNDYIRMQADKLHESFPNHHILALDLYDGKVATTREEAGALMQSAKSERIEKLIAAAAEYSGKKSKIGTIGWCFGGAWSNKAAVLLKDKVAACVMYYGMPVKDDAQIAQIKAPVLGIFANKDGWITPKVVQEFKEKMVKNGKSIETFGYEAEHAFANPSNPKYHKAYSDEAWSKSISFFKVNL